LSGGEHTVLVLGAGASLAEAMARRPKQSREWPPLDATFFRNATKHRNTELLGKVVEQAAKLGEQDLTGDSPSVSLEAHLGRLYFEMSHNPIKAGVQAYFDAVRLYSWEITATTNWMMGKPGLMKKLIQDELRAGRRVSIVTFNVDLLAENALNYLDGNIRMGADWCLETTYGLPASRRKLRYEGRGFTKKFGNDIKDSEIMPYKMHGSVNWVFSHRDEHPPADLVSKKDRKLYVLTNERLPQTALKVRGEKDRRAWYLSPLLVPPVYEKHSLIKRYMHDVWDGASKVFGEASRVVFWGYSFPQADVHARYYFQGLAQENEALREPITINPDPDAESALWQVLRPKSVEPFRSAEDYLASA
jgi:hypothetical protein